MDISKDLNEIIMAAYREAETRGHEYLTPEHVLYASLFFDRGKEIILSCGGSVESLARDLEGFFGARVPVVLTSRSDNVQTRLASCAVGLLVAHARRTGLPGGGDIKVPDSRGER